MATPIGNLQDITLRAIETLKSVDLIACEDTRVSRKLLDHFGIKKPLISLHQHSDDRRISEIIESLNRGQNIAYITDSGTPGISDPGQKLVSQIRNPKSEILNNIQIQNSKFQTSNEAKKLNVISIPGPSAVTAAISVSGMVNKEFYFAGFLPKKKGRQTKMIELAKIEVPIVIYESALRLEKTLQDIEKYFGRDCEIFIAREMTKIYEEYFGGKVSDVLENIHSHKLKGEIVLLIKHS